MSEDASGKRAHRPNLSDLDAVLAHVASIGRPCSPGDALEGSCGVEQKRTYRFVITFEVEHDHPAHGDPEWAADAAWGALTNEYGLRSIYTDIEEVPPTGGE